LGAGLAAAQQAYPVFQKKQRDDALAVVKRITHSCEIAATRWEQVSTRFRVDVDRRHRRLMQRMARLEVELRAMD
jgi:hypothetical protein